jgi:hypothetical protein
MLGFLSTYRLFMSIGGDGIESVSALEEVFSCISIYYYIQGADKKLGQFLIQDIYATANHRNCLRHSLESCPSLV